MKEINVQAMMRLKAYRRRLTWKQYSVMKGQILAGDADGAMKGLDRILRRAGERVCG